MNQDLLEYFYERTSEDCLSDLREATIFMKYITLMESIDDAMFPLKEWLYLYQYVCDEAQHDFQTVKDVKAAIKEWTKQ